MSRNADEPGLQSAASSPARRDGDHGTDRIGRIQYARAIAALTVMLSHAATDVAVHGGFPPFSLVQLGAAGVDLFFIISGFVMVHSSTTLFGKPGARRLFLERRIWRVVPLYWAATLAYGLMLVLRGNGGALSLGQFAASMIFLPVENQSGSMLPTYGIGWTLNYEMFFYACFAAGLGLTLKRGLTVIAIALCALVTLHMLVDLPQPMGFWTHPVLLEFLLGLGLAVAFRAGVRLTPLAGRLAMAVGLAALLGTTALGIGYSPDAPQQATLRWLFWGVPCGLCFAGMVLRRPAATAPHPVFGLLGDASYALYLVHPIIIILLRPILPGLTAAMGSNATLAGLSQFGLDGLVAIACAIAIHVGVERPLLRARRRRPSIAAGSAVRPA